MVKTSKKSTGYNSIMERIILLTKIVPFNEQNKCIDFKEGDVVRCSYMQGLFKVYDLSQNSVFVYNLDMTSDIERVDPRFLEKIQVNQQVMDVLYGD